MKSQIRKIIKEEIQRLLLLEKFEDPTLASLHKLIGGGRWSDGRKLFSSLAKSKGIDWANAPVGATVAAKQGSSDSNIINVYVVTTGGVNTTGKGDGFTLSRGLLGITVGNKIAGFNGNLVSNKGDRAGASYSNKGIWNFKQMNAHADKVYQIDTSLIPNTRDMQKSREEAKRGATALMNARDILYRNKRRYEEALILKAGAGGWKSAREYVKRAHETLGKAIDANTKMLSNGEYASGWDSHYSLASRLYENIMKEFQNFQEQNKAYLKAQGKKDGSRAGGTYNKDRMDQALKTMKDYYNDFDKRMKRVMAEKPKKIQTAY